MNPAGAEHVCVVIGRTRHKMIQIEIQEAAKRGARMIELRLDFLTKSPDYKRLLVNKPCPLVATLRRPADGGRWSGTEEARLTLIRQAIVAGFDWIDIETDIATTIRRFKTEKRIVSYHNLREVPDDLEVIHARMCNQDPDVVKIAVLAQDPADNLRVLKLIKDSPKPTVAFCMGDLGFPSRLLMAKYGAPFTYAAFNRERGMAPGIPTFEDLVQIYDYERVNVDTQIYGVIGDPVAHSLSPRIHNAAFRHLGINSLYLPFRVPRGGLTPFLGAHRQIPVQGYSVTIPHKEAAAMAAAVQDPSVDQTKAANTLVFKDGKFHGYNTDYDATAETIRAGLPPLSDGTAPALTGRATLILGAGGVARAVAFALHKEGATLTIANRTAERAQKLAEELGARWVDWEARHNVACDLVVNCTSVGMTPNVDDSPLHNSFLKPGLVVFDTVYTPETTMLVREARDRGCVVITGVELFVRQAARQFRLFADREPPLDLMRDVVRRALSPVALTPAAPAAPAPAEEEASEESSEES